MNLIIDIGNTRIKLGVFENAKLIHNESVTIDGFIEEVKRIIGKFKCKNAIISSVGALNKDQINQIRIEINLIELKSSTKVPFKNMYASPKTLGVDRIALVASAISKYPNKNVLVIDAGSCITCDFINAKGEYFGGSISPGMQMRYKALNSFTSKLPLLEPTYVDKMIGDSTNQSIHIGIVQGVINEIDSFINAYRKINSDLTVVLTGGDTNFLSNRLKNGIFANPFFLMEGLNTILKYNLD